MKLSIVIPVYRGEETLGLLFERLQQALDGRYDYEVIFVHDCGPDKSWDVIKKLHSATPSIIKAMQLSRNYGQQYAILCGIAHSTGDFVVTMDEDLQHDPSDIISLIKVAESENADVVYGHFIQSNHSTGWRNTASNFLRKMLRLALPDLPPYYSPFRLIRRDIAMQLTQAHNPATVLDISLTWFTSRFAKSQVSHHQRIAGTSGYTLKKLINQFINVVITFSNVPIRLLFIISSIVLTASSLYAIWIFANVLVNKRYQAGFPTLIIVLLMGFSLVLIGLSILGEYLHQINQKTTHKPSYVIRETL